MSLEIRLITKQVVVSDIKITNKILYNKEIFINFISHISTVRGVYLSKETKNKPYSKLKQKFL